MDFSFTDEQNMIAETAKAFFVENATSERTRKAMAADGIDKELWQGYCQELGFGGITISEDHGGSGLGMVELAIIAERAGATVAALPLLGLTTVARAIEHGGTDEQKNEWLETLSSGDAIAAAALDTEIDVSGNRLTGSINYVAHGASADLFLIVSDEQAWLVKAGASGLNVENQTTMDQTRPLAKLTLENVQGEALANSKDAIEAATSGALVCLAAEALGGAQECLDRTVAYSQERIQFGRQIGSFQAYKHRLADLMVAIEQARSATYWAACAVDEKTHDMQLALHSAKTFCADTFFKCAADMIQLHGGIGFTWEHDTHLFFKRAKAIQEMAGNGNWHREQIAAHILGEAA